MRVSGQRIDRPLEGERHRDGGELGDEQQHGRPDHAHLQVDAIRRPDERPQTDHRAPQCSAVGGDPEARWMRRRVHGGGEKPYSCITYRWFGRTPHPRDPGLVVSDGYAGSERSAGHSGEG